MNGDTTVTYEDEDGKTSVMVKGGCGNLDDVVALLIIPVLLGAGFSREAIERVIGNVE